MAPTPNYPSPHTQLGRLMVLARRRGLSFEQWWNEAVRPREALVMVNTPDAPEGAVKWPTDWNDRITWQAAIRGSKDGWRRAYERRPPTMPEAALAYLAHEGVIELEAPNEPTGGYEPMGIETHGALPSAA